MSIQVYLEEAFARGWNACFSQSGWEIPLRSSSHTTARSESALTHIFVNEGSA